MAKRNARFYINRKCESFYRSNFFEGSSSFTNPWGIKLGQNIANEKVAREEDETKGGGSLKEMYVSEANQLVLEFTCIDHHCPSYCCFAYYPLQLIP